MKSPSQNEEDYILYRLEKEELEFENMVLSLGYTKHTLNKLYDKFTYHQLVVCNKKLLKQLLQKL